jgi:hypothetical protein
MEGFFFPDLTFFAREGLPVLAYKEIKLDMR